MGAEREKKYLDVVEQILVVVLCVELLVLLASSVYMNLWGIERLSS